MLTEEGRILLVIAIEDWQERKKKDPSMMRIEEYLMEYQGAPGTTAISEMAEPETVADEVEAALLPEALEKINRVAKRLQAIPEEQWMEETSLGALLS